MAQKCSRFTRFRVLDAVCRIAAAPEADLHSAPPPNLDMFSIVCDIRVPNQQKEPTQFGFPFPSSAASPYPASCTPKLPGHQPPRRSLSPARHIVAKSPKPDCRSHLFAREIASRGWPKISPKCCARKSWPKMFLYLNHTHKFSVPHFRSHIRSFGFAFSVPVFGPARKGAGGIDVKHVIEKHKT